MAAAYSKELLISAYLHRFRNLSVETTQKLEKLAIDLYDKVGRDEFRVYGSVTPQAIRDYKNSI
jgi:hypothetical protein